MIVLVRAASGEQDVEILEVPPPARYRETLFKPVKVIRRGQRYLVEVAEFPGEWWMGELVGATVVLWGSYGTLEEAARSS